ncbi:MFS transporter [Pelagibacterium limicola]|uniref:MFS transporter n=1 Tax=Pelagibacterium limicola TaxID=2791022 RepID=UPI0018B00703|nr:MFS transporter [Pelagibacterium limicola]
MTGIAESSPLVRLPFGLRTDRIAVSVLFLVNGFLIGSWAPKIPLLMHRLEIGETIMGLLILAFGVGSVTMMPVIGAMTAKYGSAPVLRVVSVVVLPLLLVITLLPELWMVAIIIVLFGGFIGGMDVAMNANAVAVEKRMAKPIMSSCHGFWSLGGLIGAGSGGLLIGTFGEIGHAIIFTIAATLAIVLILPWIARDHTTAATREATPLRFPRSPLPYLVGLMALFSMLPEGTILDWSAHFLQKELDASIEKAALGFAAFSGTMAVMRFLGDAIRERLGAILTLRICTGIAMIGMVIGSLAPTADLAIAGFAFAGLGIANMVPIAFSAAGNLPGVPAGIGLSIVTVMGYSGILVAPSVIGFLAERVGFSPVLLGVTSLLLVPLLLSRLGKYADFTSG